MLAEREAVKLGRALLGCRLAVSTDVEPYADRKTVSAQTLDLGERDRRRPDGAEAVRVAGDDRRPLQEIHDR